MTISNFNITFQEMVEDGSIYTYDAVADAGYVQVPLQPAGAAIKSTRDLGDGIRLDIDSDGQVYGIERIGGPVDRWVLMRVIRHLTGRQEMVE